MAEIVVTGAQGFLGTNLVAQLVAEFQDVCATWNYQPPASPERTKYLSQFRCNVNDFTDCAKLIMQENPEIVYHLVAQPIVTAAIRDPLRTFELTTRGTWNMLEAIRLYGTRIKAIVFVSSDKVYGNNTNASEQSGLRGIDHPYNVAKVAADVISQSYATTYDLPIVISRSANLYGPADFHWDRIVPGISRDIITERIPHIRSNGKQMRDYIYVGDGVRALMHMADAMSSGKINKGSIFNFGSEKMYSSAEVVHMLLEVAGRVDLMPVIDNGAQDEIQQQHIDYTHATKVLGWRPMIGMERGLDLTFAWYKNWFKK
jgi:CDP-glucose 4,6-dehydratase